MRSTHGLEKKGTGNRPASWTRTDAWIVALLFLGTLLVFSRSLENDFVGFDDRLYVVGNAEVRAGLSLPGLAWAFRTQHTGNWHPLTWLSHMLDCEWYGLSPRGHHLTSVVLHAANASLLFLLLLSATGARFRSAIVAALFALHPLHVESVAWVAERKDVLSGFFFLAAVWCWVIHARRGGARSYLATLGLFALGLLAKPMVVTLPLVLLLLDVWPLRRQAGRSRLLLEKAPFFLLSAASCWITIAAQRGGGNVTSLETLSLGARIANALVGTMSYLARTVDPRRLSFFYPYPAAIPGWKIALSATLLLAVTALVLLGLRRRPYLAVGWLWYVGMLLPVAGLIQVGAQSTADRYTYLPLIGIFSMAVWGIAEWSEGSVPRRVRAGAVCAVLLTCAALTWRQQGFWQDSPTLYGRALAVTSNNYVVEDLLGSYLARNGRLEEGIARHESAIRSRPGYSTAHNNLANALALRGDLARSIEEYRIALRLEPDLVEAHQNLASVLEQKGDRQGALEELAVAVRLRPDDAELLRRLDALRDSEGR